MLIHICIKINFQTLRGGGGGGKAQQLDRIVLLGKKIY